MGLKMLCHGLVVDLWTRAFFWHRIFLENIPVKPVEMRRAKTSPTRVVFAILNDTCWHY